MGACPRCEVVGEHTCLGAPEPKVRRIVVPRCYLDWLDAVADTPEADLPCNVSTVAYAIKTASLLRQAGEEWAALFDELLASTRRDPASVVAVVAEALADRGIRPEIRSMILADVEEALRA